jgi:hypothetical protein
MCDNLNADLLDGNHATAFVPYQNNSADVWVGNDKYLCSNEIKHINYCVI